MPGRNDENLTSQQKMATRKEVIKTEQRNSELSDNPIRMAGPGEKLTSNFLSRTREQLFEKFIKEQTRGPPVGTYRSRFNASDPKIRSPLYGTESTWGGDLAKKANKIKE